MEHEIDSHITFAKDGQIKDLLPAYVLQKLILQQRDCEILAAQLQLSLDRNAMIGKVTACLVPFKELKFNTAQVLASSMRCITTALVEAKCVKRKLSDDACVIVKKVARSNPSDEPTDKKTKNEREL